MARRTGKDARQALAGFLRHPRYEIVPLEGVEQSVLEHVPRDIKLTVTASPSKGIRPTIELTESLARYGYEVVPHLSARLIRDKAHLSGVVGRLEEAGVRDVFVIAGDAGEPAGEFEGARALLRTMDEMGNPFEEVGIAGYPEGHPFISEEELVRALHEKAPYASYVVTQICFDAGLIARWARQVREQGMDLPIYAGLPGYVSRQKLMRISANIGLGESARFLRKQRRWLWRLLLPGGYDPKGLMEDLADSGKTGIAGFHINTFNELEKTESWRQKMLGG